MKDSKYTIVLVLRSGGDFSYRDVELIARHINGKWMTTPRPRILCLWDKVENPYDLGNIEFLPLKSEQPGTWSRIELYSPEMEKYRPFLYIDLDTAVIHSLEDFFILVDPTKFIVLEDFWQKGRLATGLVWFPANSEKIKRVWEAFKVAHGRRMDNFLRSVVVPDMFWQQLTQGIYDFKPAPGKVLSILPKEADIVCFHGKPRIFGAGASSMGIEWVREYINQPFSEHFQADHSKVSIIIPYNKDRGFLQAAIASVPKDVQLILSKGNGYWTENFNKALPQVTGDYIKYLHEDDMLTENCIDDSILTMIDQGVDFIHGNAIEIYEGSTYKRISKPRIQYPTEKDLLTRNCIHSATLMYSRKVFETVGGFNESLGRGVSEEYEFNLRCLHNGLKIGYCDSTLAYYRRHKQQKIKTTPRDIKNKEREMVKAMYQ